MKLGIAAMSWIALAGALSAAAPAEAVPALDSAAVLRLQSRLSSRQPVRIVGPRVDRVLLSPAFTVEGVVDPVGAGGPGLVPWSEIDRVQRKGRATGRGATLGAVIGGLSGIALGSLLAARWGASDRARLVVPYLGVVGALGGTLGGAVVGTAFEDWQDVQSWPRKARLGSSWGLENP